MGSLLPPTGKMQMSIDYSYEKTFINLAFQLYYVSSDYCLTTIFQNGEKSCHPPWPQDFWDSTNPQCILCNAAETRANTGFPFDGLKTPTL